MKLNTHGRILLSTALASVAVPHGHLQAQTMGSVEEIVVTARKRAESLKDVPMSVQALSSDALFKLNTKDLSQITRFAPGLSYEQTAANFSYRFLPQIRFRGMATNNSGPNAQVGAVFEDGVFVVGGAQSMSTSDAERVEIMKGPQNAYFGRNTLGGAINFVTREPANEFKGELSADLETRESHRIVASAEGPLVQDKVNARLSAENWRDGAHYFSDDGGDLGRAETTSVTATAVFKPVDQLKVKLRGHYQEDSDFGNANYLFRAQGDFANCRPATIPWYCGALPSIGDAVSLQNGTSRIVPESNWMETNITPPRFSTLGRPNALRDFLNNRSGVMNDIPFFAKLPTLDHFGSERKLYRVTGSFAYDLPSNYEIAGSASYGHMAFAGLWDSDNVFGLLPGTGTRQYVFQPYLTSDVSAEVRLVSPQDGKFRWLAGANTFKQKLDGALGASQKSVNAITATENTNVFQNTDRDRSQVSGVFAAISYDVVSNVTIDLEGRYQSDKLKAFQQIAPNRFDPIDRKFKNFLPRVIASYKPDESTNLYASWSRGALPGVANATFETLVNTVVALPANPLRTTDREQVRSLLSGLVGVDAPLTLAAEKLDQYEVGWKQEMADGRAYLSLAGYYSRWKNMKVAVAATNLANARLTNGILLPSNGDINGDGISDSVRATVAGSSRIYGLEFEAAVSLIDRLSLNFNGEITNSKYTGFFASGTTVTALAGIADLNGRRLSLYPLYKGSLSTRWEDTLTAEWNYYAQSTATLNGKTYVDPANLTWNPSFWLVNASLGVSNGAVLVEVFGKNIANHDGWTTGRLNGAVDGTQTVALAPARKRTWGVRSKVQF